MMNIFKRIGLLGNCIAMLWLLLKTIAFSYLDSEYTICIKDFEMKQEYYYTEGKMFSTCGLERC